MYQISSEGKPHHLANLYPLKPKGFWLEPRTKEVKEALYPYIPYFLDDLRPSGFLGRLIPGTYPELQAPNDIQMWTIEHCLAYWSRYGWNLTQIF